MLLAAAALTAGVLSASAQGSNVYSVNIVGYVNRPLQGNNNYSLIANPLSSATNTYEGVLRAALPPGWSVLRWTGTTFSPASRTSFGTGWSPAAAGTNSFGPGEAVFILAPSGAAPLTNTFVGNVMTGSFTNTLTGGTLSLVGNIIADGGSVTNLNFAPPAGSIVQLWKEDGIGGYTPYTRTSFGSTWSPSIPSINVGQGFFVTPQSTYNWIRNFNP
jgi:hypothetical protein